MYISNFRKRKLVSECGIIFLCSQHLRIQYDELVPALCNKYPDVFPPELYTWEQFLWACELWYSNSMKVMFPDGKLRTCLIPFAGFLNHSVCTLPLYFDISVLNQSFLCVDG